MNSYSWPDADWNLIENPDKLGWSADKLAKVRAYSVSINSAAVLIVQNGKLIAGWGDISRNFHAHSMRKSLVNPLFGIYLNEGKIDVNKTLADLDIDDDPPLTETEKQARIIDLLKARSGIYIPAVGESGFMKATRPTRGSHPPGTYWYYNNWDFNALGTIFDQETGTGNLYKAFQTLIAEPIGMQDFSITGLQYTYYPPSLHPYYGFDISGRDLARFGLLFARGGLWKDRQLIPKSWIEESRYPHSDAGAFGGFGYLWWIAKNGRHLPNVLLPHGSFSAQGGPGQFLLVLPDQDIIIVHLVDSWKPCREVPLSELGHLVHLIFEANDLLYDEMPSYSEDQRLQFDVDMQQYIGQYECQTLGLPAYIELHNNDLVLKIEGMDVFPIIAITPTRFLIKNWLGGLVEFDITETQIKSMTVVLSEPGKLIFTRL